jgi:hypothetical protein
MSSNFYSVGLNHVGAYQVAGTPYVSSSALPNTNTESLRFQFPKVTKKICVTTDSSQGIRVHFAPYLAGEFGYTEGADTNDNYIIVENNHTFELPVKCKEVFISATQNGSSGNTVQIFAELTNIPAERMFNLDTLEGVTQ